MSRSGLPYETPERWKVLCERAIHEQDREKFLATIRDLIEELETKEQQLKGPTAPHSKPSGEERAKVDCV